MCNYERWIHKKYLNNKRILSKLINVEPICVPEFWVSIIGVSGAIYLSVNTTTDFGLSFSELPDEEPVGTVFLES